MTSSLAAIPYWTSEHVKRTLPLRSEDSHKGTFGTGLLLAGTRDMPGAALLAGLAAMRSGIGKLEIATDPEVIGTIVPLLPEATYLRNGMEKTASGEIDLDSYRTLAAGPGLPPNSLVEKSVQAFLATDRPVVLDAGALSQRVYQKRTAPTILTPHPQEFSRITGIPKDELLEKPNNHIAQTAQQWGVTIVLKGRGTLIAFPEGEVWRNPTGNSALAKGGTGDTLTGMMLGMLCCHADWRHAVLNAVYLHGACADVWIQTRSAHTLLAHELTDLLPEVWKQHEST